MKELKLMAAKQVVISSNVELRLDGLPYASFKEPDDSAVAVYFRDKNERPVCFACDRWDSVKDNLHAIHLTIQALRGIGRWGTGDMLEASFRGFEALPPPATDWHEILGVSEDASIAECESAYKRRARLSHPDAGGSADEMAKLNQAIHEARTRVAS